MQDELGVDGVDGLDGGLFERHAAPTLAVVVADRPERGAVPARQTQVYVGRSLVHGERGDPLLQGGHQRERLER